MEELIENIYYEMLRQGRSEIEAYWMTRNLLPLKSSNHQYLLKIRKNTIE